MVTAALSFAAVPSRAVPLAAQDNAKLDGYKKEAVKGVDEMAKLAQEMVDSVFSFGELGMQEVETSRYLTAQLEKFGFKITRGQSGIPTAWVATYGSGKPVIALGSDIDGIPQSSQKPGVAYHDPIVEGAPGHGEGHNTGMPLNIIAAIAVKRIMERDKLPGTIMLWPGVAEELVASKAWFVRDGMFKDVDVNLFTHVGNNLGRRLGPAGRHRPGVDGVHVRRRDGAQRRRAVARPLGARRRRADEHRLAVSPRAPAPVAALALGHHQRRRSAERGAAQRQHLVLLPRDRSAAHQGAGRDRQQDGRGRGADDQHQDDLTHSRHRVSAPLQQGGRRDDVREHQDRGPADVERRGSDARQGAAEGARQRDAERPRREARRAGPAGSRSRTTPAAAPTTSATFPGTCRP